MSFGRLMLRGSLLATLAAVVAIPVLWTGQANADFCSNIVCGSGGPRTATETASSDVDCPWARMAAIHQLEQDANCVFGFCERSFETLSDCNTDTVAPFEATIRMTWICNRCRGPFTQCP